MIPDSAISMFNAANRSGGESLVRAAALYTQLKDTALTATDDLKNIDRVETVAAYLQGGMDPGQAIETLTFNESMTDAQKQTVKNMFNEKTEKADNAKSLADLFTEKFDPTIFFGGPDMPAHMVSEFESSVQLALPTVAYDLKTAQQKAFNQISSKYTPTKINGSTQVMPYMPSLPDKYVRAQIDKQLEKGASIQSDQLTIMQKRNGLPLTYQAWKQNDDGTIENLGRYNYDPKAINKKMEGDKVKEREERLEKGRKKQAAEIARKERRESERKRQQDLSDSYIKKRKAQMKGAPNL